jgi:class 3 adenylate cyclase
MIAPRVDSVAAQQIRDNFNERLESLTDCLAAISGMRTMPDESDLRIGGAKRTRGVVLFADIVKSTRLAAKYSQIPEKMLATLDLVIPTLMDLAGYYRGEFEKNTGDGILAYFGVGIATDQDAAALALDAAVGMMEAVRDLANPVLKTNGLEPVQITIGADLGEFLVARIGLARQQTPIVAVGAVANRAAKIQGSSSPGQVRVGEDFFKTLSKDSRALFTSVNPPTPWPFQVPKTTLEIENERYFAEQDAKRKLEDQRLLYPHLPNSVLHPLPPIISPARAYRVYAMKQRW